MQNTARPRLSVFASHPTQFEGPLYPKIAARGQLDLAVYFWTTDQPVTHLVDRETDLRPQWQGLALTGGYEHYVLPPTARARWRFIQDRALVPPDRRTVLVNGWSGQAAQMALLATRIKRMPLILRLDTVDIYPLHPLKALRRWAGNSLMYRLPAAFMATSTLTRRHLLRRGVPDKAIFTFPYALDNDYLEAATASIRPRRDALRRDLGIPPDKAAILTAVKFIQREGVWDLLHAYSELAALHESTILVLVGDGPLRPEIEAFLATRPGMPVVRTGWVTYGRLLELYAASDVFVHPGVREQWGCSVQEAAACRLPVVGSSLVGATHDLVRHGVNGLVYSGGDVASLKQALSEIIARRTEWPAMSEHSWELAQPWGHMPAIREIERAVDYALAHGDSSR